MGQSPLRAGLSDFFPPCVGALRGLKLEKLFVRVVIPRGMGAGRTRKQVLLEKDRVLTTKASGRKPEKESEEREISQLDIGGWLNRLSAETRSLLSRVGTESENGILRAGGKVTWNSSHYLPILITLLLEG